LRVSWTASRSNQSILKEINPEYSLEGLVLTLQYFGHLMQRADILMLHKIEDLSKVREIVKDKVAWHAAVHAMANSQT